MLSPVFESFCWDDNTKSQMAISIRTQVFVIEQNVPAELELDGKDPDAVHLLIHYKGHAVATARLRFINDACKFERFAVLKEFRKMGLGRKLVHESLKLVPENLVVFLHAQIQVVDFYKSFGFTVEGEAFEEAGIIHYNMVLKR